MEEKDYATEKERIDHCEKYPCSTCIIAHRCSMFESLFGYLPETPNQSLDSDGKKRRRSAKSLYGIKT